MVIDLTTWSKNKILHRIKVFEENLLDYEKITKMKEELDRRKNDSR